MTPTWDELRIEQVLALDRAGEGRWRSRHGDPNMNGRSYGGQLLGQALMAALMEAPEGRAPSMMQFLFLQGAMPAEPIDFQVEVLQEGKRFSSRRVAGSQAGSGRRVLDAQVTCALPLASAEHGTPSGAPPGERPERQPQLADVPRELLDNIRRLGGYSEDRKPSIEFRIPDALAQLSPGTAQSRFRFWMRAVRPLPEDARVRAAAFAYMSDWWVNFSGLAAHLALARERSFYISSLNHAIWMHRPVRPDEWLHVETHSPLAASGRALSVARFHDAAGRLVASATQESLMAFAD
jgi:acyl-CoA thioesterase-2